MFRCRCMEGGSCVPELQSGGLGAGGDTSTGSIYDYELETCVA